MKAILCRQYGAPSLLQLENVDRPEPASQELLVRVNASTVNRTDCAILSARPFIMRFFTGLLKPKKAILGTEFSGEVLAVGEGVKEFKPGDRVFGFNDLGLSAHAEYLAINTNQAIALVPGQLSMQQAAASIEGAHYAYNYINKLSIQPRSKILINGAGGAIGSALLQFCVELGAEVTAVSEERHRNLLLELGAVYFIDYRKTDFSREQTQYDFVFDVVGTHSYQRCKSVLNAHGIYISSELGRFAQNLYLPLLTRFSSGQKVVFPIPGPIKASLRFIVERLKNRKFIPILDRSFPLDQIAAAYDYVASGVKTGNVVIEIP
ncbi:NAD(P)-dependent alcohol dehydrogenase [Undibacterium sp. Di24W]|uniref:NAD(P)-dependent alcohol dehydrogenase n=1 Tax=Undibacterium sp. Di24W TaxID=3413033 RepID=UPI003BF0E670